MFQSIGLQTILSNYILTCSEFKLYGCLDQCTCMTIGEKGFVFLGHWLNFFSPSVFQRRTSAHETNNPHGRFIITKAQQNRLVLDEPKKYLWCKTIATPGTCNIRASCRGVGLVPTARLLSRGRWRLLAISCASPVMK